MDALAQFKAAQQAALAAAQDRRCRRSRAQRRPLGRYPLNLAAAAMISGLARL